MNKYDWKYILKRVLTFFAIFLLLSLFKLMNTKAASVGALMTENNTMIERPLYAQFWDCSGGTFNTATTTSDPYLGWFSTNITITTNGCGAGISFLSNEPIVEGATYALVVYMGSNNSSSWFAPSRYYGAKYSVGNNIPLAAQNFNNGIRLNTLYSSYSDGSNQLYYSTGQDTGNPAPYYTAAFTLIFKAVATGSYIFVPFNSGANTQTSYTLFYGYNLTNYGNLDGLSSSDIQNIIAGSGLATASSVSDLQRSVNQLQSQLADVDSSIQSQTQQQHTDHQETINTITSDDTTGAESSVDSLLQNDAFSDSSGVNAIISLPLNFIQSLTSKSCRALLLNIPYMNEVVQIPCMQNYIHTNAPTLYLIIKNLVNGFVIYRVLLDILSLVKSARNPDDDRIEVLDL